MRQRNAARNQDLWDAVTVLWNKDVPRKVIRERLSLNKNQLTGIITRAELPHRPGIDGKITNLLPDGTKAPRVQRPNTRAQQKISGGRLAEDLIRNNAKDTLAKLEVVKPPVASVAVVKPVFIPRVVQCCWVLGDCKPWRTCDALAEPKKPYCAEHSKLAYVTVRTVVRESL